MLLCLVMVILVVYFSIGGFLAGLASDSGWDLSDVWWVIAWPVILLALMIICVAIPGYKLGVAVLETLGPVWRRIFR